MTEQRIDRFVNNMNAIHKNNTQEIINSVYTNDVTFVDPVKKIDGIEAVNDYFAHLYKSVDECKFDITAYVQNGNHDSIEWVMSLKHQKIAKGKELKLDGASFIEYRDDKVCYQKDYYDLGALIYEQIPVIGSIIKKIRHAI